MYIKRENLQALRSQQMITNALLSLMKSYPYEDISITQICEEAQVVRRTFYRNFEAKIDILEFYLDNMIKQYSIDYLNIKLDMYDLLKNYFEFSLLHKEFLLQLEKNNLFFLLDKSIKRSIYKFIEMPKIKETIADPALDDYVLGFIASTASSLLSLWVKNNFKEATETLAKLAETFFSGLEKAVRQEAASSN